MVDICSGENAAKKQLSSTYRDFPCAAREKRYKCQQTDDAERKGIYPEDWINTASIYARRFGCGFNDQWQSVGPVWIVFQMAELLDFLRHSMAC
jgi:hypothetical protein